MGETENTVDIEVDFVEQPEEIQAEQAEWSSPQSVYERELFEIENLRQYAYQREADPLYFQWQAGESTQEAWQAKRAEIRERYPYPQPPGE